MAGPPRKILPEIQSLIGKSNNARANFQGVKSAFQNIHNVNDGINAVRAALSYGTWLSGLFVKGKQVPQPKFTQSPIQKAGWNQIARETDANKRPRSDKFSISSFLSNIERVNGLAKTNRFMVDFSGLANTEENRNLTMMCESVEFPGRTLEFTEAVVYGPAYKMPYASTYQEITLTFLCDRFLNQKAVFDNWMNVINPISNFDFNYRNNYTIDMKITQYDELGNETYICQLIEAYPVSVAPLTASWQDDQFHKVQVTMSYRYWVSESPPAPKNQSVNIPTDTTYFPPPPPATEEELTRYNRFGESVDG